LPCLVGLICRRHGAALPRHPIDPATSSVTQQLILMVRRTTVIFLVAPLAVRCSSDLVIFRYRSGVAADNNNHRYIPELLRAAADVRFDPEATKGRRADSL
jgi:hypothetical protein